MGNPTHKTRGIVLRTVKYGETSVIVLIFTEKFGIQSYLVNGVRKASKKSAGKAVYFQPSAILDLVAYHNEFRQLNRLREFHWSYVYKHIFSDVVRNAAALFMVELLIKSLKQPEANESLFHFAEDTLVHLDTSNPGVTANVPLFFALHLAVFFGVLPGPPRGEIARADELFFDLKEGEFLNVRPDHPDFLEGRAAKVTAELLSVRTPGELEEIRLNQAFRRELLKAYETYFAYHFQDFGRLKSLPVLETVLG